MDTYYFGSQVKMQGVFKVDDIETDPTSSAIRCLYKIPDGTVTAVSSTTADIVKDTTGTYYLLVTPTSAQVGDWYYRWHATAGVIVGGESVFTVISPEVTT
jgi:hypothetical protein